MNKFLFLLLAAAPGLAVAQSKINLAGLDFIEQNRNMTVLSPDGVTRSLPVPVIITPETDDCAAVLESMGFAVEDLGATVVAEIPVGRVSEVAALPQVRFLTVGQEVEATMNFARPACNVEDVQNGFNHDNAEMKFDGTGVLASLYDSGMDANHVNFKNDDGKTRIKKLWAFTTSATPKEYTPDSKFSNITSFTTDDQSSTHATHVAGIMAGSYKGSGRYADVATASGSAQNIKEGYIPFYGVATGADLAFSVGSLNTSYILAGLKKIVDYAGAQNMPFVINLSLGSTSGPHDGTDSYSQQLAEYGKKGIICIAAGNDGDVPMSICRSVTSATPIRTLFLNNKSDGGYVDIWAQGSDAVTVSVVAYNPSTGAVTKLATIDGNGQTGSVTSTNATFASSFTGSVTMRSDVNRLNNRFNVFINCNFAPKSSSVSQKLGLVIESANEQNVYVYGNTKTAFTSGSYAGWENGSAENSINDAASAANVVSVGSFTTRTSWGALGGGPYSYTSSSYVVNRISPFSSYGKTFQGKQLPLVCAPGAAVVSSISRFNVAALNSSNRATASATVNSVVNYWGAEQGTSMACPYVSGVVALWLQACPTLTYDQVMEVIDKTSTFSPLSMKGGRWGAGKINALEGVKYILGHFSSVGSVWDDDELRLVVSPAGGGYDVVLAGEAAFGVEVYDLQGRKVVSAAGHDGNAHVATAGLQPGVYVLAVKGASYSTSRKIVVR